MQHFKHSELAKEYHVSMKTVYNWIDAAKQGKIDLELVEQGGRTYVENKQSNVVALRQLAEEGKKYRNTRFQKVITPKPKFYELFSRKQTLDLITNLNVHREIPRQYNYFDGGATNWDRFASHRMHEDSPNLLTGTIDLLHANLGAIDHLLKGHDRVNVVDIGPGNAIPVRELLEHLLERGKLHRYIAIDISESMLQIAEANIKEWFGDKIKFEGYVKDITYERFDDLLVDDMLDESASETINLALVLGATPMNFQSPYDSMKTVCKSLGYEDLLIYTDKPENGVDRQYFDVNADPDPRAKALSSKYSFLVDLLGIDDSLYDVEMGYDAPKRARYIRIRLKVALTIQFEFPNGRRNVDLDKDDTILLWRGLYQTTLEIVGGFEQAGFTLLQASLTKDRGYLLTIHGVYANASIDA